MPAANQLDSLMLAWQEARAAGRDPTARELCRDCPDLAPKLAERIELLRQMSGLGKDDTTTNPGPGPASDVVPMPTRIGDYHILTRLGQGGMGAVYWAEDERLKRPTAIKVLRPELAARPGARERFLQEARAAAAIEHEAIVPIWHVGEDRGVLYLAMPMLRGESLADRLARGRLPPADVVRVARHVAAGLAAAHQAGLIHRDIKPANIWLDRKDGADPASFDRARVLDFGLARFEDEEASRLTGTGDVLGTPAYMAPEQARGEDADARADLFGLGCVLYHAATGNPPFRAPTVMGTLLAVAQEHPPDPRSLVPELPARLSALINRLMKKDRDDRPATAAEVVRLLKTQEDPDTSTQILPGERSGVSRPMTSSSGPLRGPARRIALASAAVLVVAVVALAIFKPWRSRSTEPAPPVADLRPDPADPIAALDRKRIPDDELLATWQPPQVVAVVGGHAGLVGPAADDTHAAISPDGRWVVWSGPTGVRVWDADRLRLQYRHPSAPACVPKFRPAFQNPEATKPDYFQLLSPLALTRVGSGGQIINLLDSGPRIERGIGLRAGPVVTALAISRDGFTVATGTAAGEIRLWDANDLKPQVPEVLSIAPARPGPSNPVRQLTFADSGRRLIALCHDGPAGKTDPPAGKMFVRAWGLTPPEEAETGWKKELLFDLEVGAEVRRVGVHPFGNRLFVPTVEMGKPKLGLWFIGTKGKEAAAAAATFTGDLESPAREVDFLSTQGLAGQLVRLWVKGADGASAVWKFDTNRKKGFDLEKLTDLPARTMAVTPDWQRRVVLAADGRLTIQNPAGVEKASGPVPLADATRPPVLVGDRLFTFVPTPRAWEVRGGVFVHATTAVDLKPAAGPVTGSPAVSRGGTAFAWRVRDDVHVYQVGPTAVQHWKVLAVKSPVKAFAWGADDRTIRTAHADGTVRAWDLSAATPTNSPAGTIPATIRDGEYALAATGPDLFASSADRKLLRYNLAEPTASPAEVGKDAGARVWPSPSGNRVLADAPLGLALIGVRGKESRTTLEMPARPTAVQWAADERHVLVTLDGLLYVLRLE